MNERFLLLPILTIDLLAIAPGIAPSFAQFTQLTDCVAGTKLYIAAQTRNYLVQVCKTNSGSAKLIFNPRSGQVFQRQILTVPFNTTQQFVASSGNTRYFLNSKVLRVVKNNRIVVREFVIKWDVKENG
jgi:DNA polymerase III epsilon subunit-like protein